VPKTSPAREGGCREPARPTASVLEAS